MKKLSQYIFTVILLVLSMVIWASATDGIEKNFEETEKELYALIDDDIKSVINFDNLESIDSSSIESVSRFFSETLNSKIYGVLKFTLVIIAVIMLISAFSLTFTNCNLLDLLSVLSVILLTVSKTSHLINMSLSSVSLCSKFMLGFIPIYAGIIAFSGNTATAVSYNSISLMFAEGLSFFGSAFASKVVGGYYCLAISFAPNKNINLNSFVNAFNKFITFSFGILSSLFATFLTIRSVLSSAVDTVSAKGIRLLISSTIPIIGGAISEAFSTLAGSINVLKSSVAVVGIIVLLVIIIPSVTEGFLYYISLNFLSYIGELCNCRRIAELTKALSIGIKFLIMLQILQLFLLIISTALMLTIKSVV